MSQALLRFLATRALLRGPVRPLDQIQKEYIIAALELNGGNQARTAEQLQIGSATLYRKLKAYGLIGASRPAPPALPSAP